MLYDWSVLTCIRIINSLKRCWDQEIVTLILSLSYLWSLRPFFGLFFREKNCLQGPCSSRYHRVGRPVKGRPQDSGCRELFVWKQQIQAHALFLPGGAIIKTFLWFCKSTIREKYSELSLLESPITGSSLFIGTSIFMLPLIS